MDTTDWSPEELKSRKEEEFYVLKKSFDDFLTDYQILARQINDIYYLLNRNPHSTNTTLTHIHQMVNEINRLTNITQKEHDRIKEIIKEYE